MNQEQTGYPSRHPLIHKGADRPADAPQKGTVDERAAVDFVTMLASSVNSVSLSDRDFRAVVRNSLSVMLVPDPITINMDDIVSAARTVV